MISLYLCSRNHKNHVAEIMVSYTLFVFLACVSAHCLCLKDKRRRNQLTALSCLILYPAVALLAIGIFIGSSIVENRWIKAYHWYVIIAFLTIIITYFGVNYFMPSMHSYAG